jgi:hypothetical protein
MGKPAPVDTIPYHTIYTDRSEGCLIERLLGLPYLITEVVHKFLRVYQVNTAIFNTYYIFLNTSFTTILTLDGICT